MRGARKLCKCGEPAIARGLCVRCYQVRWRQAHGVFPHKISCQDNANYMDRELEGLCGELARCHACYKVCVGLERRVSWRREIERIENRVREVQAKISELRAPLAYLEAAK